MWRPTTWNSGDIEAEDFSGGTRIRLRYPDGSIVVGKLTVEPNKPSAWKQNDECVMARIMTSFSGDTWMNVFGADVEVWESKAFNE